MAGIIDNKGWVEKRIAHLKAALEGDELSDAQRVLVETELEQLEEEARRNRSKFRRWLLWGGRRS